MAKQLDKNNLGYLGVDFQYKLAKIFVEEDQFFGDISSIVDQNAFNDALLRNFIGTLKDYYTANNITPSYEMINIILREKSKTKNEIEECDALIKKLKFETSYEGMDFIKDTALKFFKQQNLIRIANKILDIAGKGDIERYEECQKLFDDAVTIGHEDDFGHSIFDLEEKALSNDYTVSIPTGIDALDDTLGGGLDKGKIGLIIAPAGFGKTSFTTAIDAYAASYKSDINNHQGFKVLQIYFEDDEVDITRKHFSRLTQREARDFKRLAVPDKEEISTLLSNHPDRELLGKNLRIKRFKTGTKSASDLKIYIKRLINSGFKPDLISIDYFECIAPEKGGYNSDTEWTREGVTMRQLENMAHEFNCAIWVPTQGTKDSMNSPEVIRMDQASGSAKKVHVAQVIISIARAIDDIDRSKAVVSILKNRSGKSGKIFNNVYFNNGTCTINCSDIQEFSDSLAWEDEAKKLQEDMKIKITRNIVKNQNTHTQTPKTEVIEGNYIGRVNTDINPNGDFK